MVDGLEHRAGNTLRVARVDIESGSGSALAQRYDVRAVPAYVLVRPDGAVIYRQVGGSPNVDEILRRARGASSATQ